MFPSLTHFVRQRSVTTALQWNLWIRNKFIDKWVSKQALQAFALWVWCATVTLNVLQKWRIRFIQTESWPWYLSCGQRQWPHRRGVMRRLYVGGLSHSVTQKDLKDRFGKFGEVEDVELRTRRDDEGEKTNTHCDNHVNNNTSDFFVFNSLRCYTCLRYHHNPLGV